jgi:hypothetical protein
MEGPPLPVRLPARIQARLSRWYRIEDAPSVDPFIEAADDGR